MSDHKGAALMLFSLEPAKDLLGDKSYDSSLLPDADQAWHCALHSIKPQPQTAGSIQQCALPAPPSRREHFSRLKDWRRIAVRYDRGVHTVMSAICLAATITLVNDKL
jgi:hypothetical protein